MKKQFMMLAASLFIIIGTVVLGGTTAKAAGFTITGETAPGPGEQVFTVSNYGEADNFSWTADGGFSGQFWLESIGSNSGRLCCPGWNKPTPDKENRGGWPSRFLQAYCRVVFDNGRFL